MNISGDKLCTPLYAKLSEDMPWPEEKVFYLLTGDGLFLCRNHPFFRSSVRTDGFPRELAEHKPSVKLSYPKIPQRLFERVIGYFDRVAVRYSAEAAVLLVWNQQAGRVELFVPNQTSYVDFTFRGEPYPLEVHYETPALPPHLKIMGNIHSHVDGPAYASFMDKCDEKHRPGLHIVVGRIYQEPPQLHIEVIVDGARFRISDPDVIIEGYRHRRSHDVPASWMEKISVRTWRSRYGRAAQDSSKAQE